MKGVTALEWLIISLIVMVLTACVGGCIYNSNDPNYIDLDTRIVEIDGCRYIKSSGLFNSTIEHLATCKGACK